jgi:cyclic pyranopterin phosphate synthase
MNAVPLRDLAVRWSVSEHCQLRCQYCLPAHGGWTMDRREYLSAQEIGWLLGALHRAFGVRKLRFTGGEPLLRQDLPELVERAAGLGIPDIALTTNGQLLAARAMELRRAGLRRVNISLDSLRPQVFAEITRHGRLERTLAGIEAALAAGLHPIKLNMVVMRGINDAEVRDLLEYGLSTGCQVRFLELMPIGVAQAGFAHRFVSSDELRWRLMGTGEWAPLNGEEASSSRDWSVRDASGRQTICGFISPYSHPFCRGCRRVRISADGRLTGCLARGHALPLRPALAAASQGDLGPLASLLEEAFAMKRGVMFRAGARSMAAVGG